MKLKILYLDVYYPRFLKDFYRKNNNFSKLSNFDQKELLFSELFGTSNFYSRNFERLGHKTFDIIINALPIQDSWARENGFRGRSVGDMIIPQIPLLRARYRTRLETEVLEEQIKRFNPDVIFMQDIGYLDVEFIKKIKKYTKLIIGQIASKLPPKEQFEPFDLIFSSLPNLVKIINSYGCRAEFIPLGFEPSLLKEFSKLKRIYPCSFVGGIAKGEHSFRTEMLNFVGNKIKLDFWGYGEQFLDSDVEKIKYHGHAWGRDMYKCLLQSYITINSHGEISQNLANNMRLFESTGCGSMLITDFKDNLSQFFKLDKEVVAYRSLDELIDKIKYYEKNKELSNKIALAGQRRTLQEHTYFKRLSKMNDYIKKLIKSHYAFIKKN